jgi:hypothetical protein
MSDFPKALSYNLKKISGWSKSRIQVLPDQQTVKAGNTFRFRIVGNGLVDTRSIAIYAKVSCEGTGTSGYLRLPRFGLNSLIKQLTVAVNSTTLSSIDNYNYLYNMLHDVEGADISQYAKRNTAGENYDPTVSFSSAPDADNQYITVVNDVSTGGSHTTNKWCVANNFLGWLGSLSTPIIDLSTVGDLIISCTLDNANVLWHSVGTAPTAHSYKLEEIYMTFDRCSFQSPFYYELLTSRLLEPEGLLIGYQDFYAVNFPTAQKSSGIALNWNVNASSLDKVYVSFRHNDYDTLKQLVMVEGSTLLGALASPIKSGTNPDGTDKLGDCFANSLAFVRSGASFTSSQFLINNISIDPYPLRDIEVFNKLQNYTGYTNYDAGAGYLHMGCLSLEHFKKYYFCDICDLTMSSPNSPDYYVSGLNGSGTGINIRYDAKFASTNTQSVYPIAFCQSTNVMKINAGRVIQINPPSVE